MTEQDTFIKAEEAFTDVVEQIRHDQWKIGISAGPASRAATTVREALNHHAYDDSWVLNTLAGETIAEVGTKYDGDLLGDDPRGSWKRITERTQVAVKNFDELDRTVHLSYGDFKAREYLQHITIFRGLQAWDLAQIIGLDEYQLPSDLVEAMWVQIAPMAEDLRAMGVFGPEVTVSRDATLHDRLIGLTGRTPH